METRSLIHRMCELHRGRSLSTDYTLRATEYWPEMTEAVHWAVEQQPSSYLNKLGPNIES